MSCFPEAPLRCSRRRWLLLASGVIGQAVQGEDLRRIAPPSDNTLDPSLVSFLANLRKLVAARDHLAWQKMMGVAFRVEFDVGKGPAAFQRHWSSSSATSPVWRIMEHILALPGHLYSNTLYAMPYVFARFPFDLDPLRHVVAVRNSVALLAEPNPNAKRLATLDYSIVPLAQPAQPPVMILPGGSVEVAHPTAGRCFAASSDVYHPSAHRAFFEKRAGKWRWISLAAATTEDPPELKRKRPTTG